MNSFTTYPANEVATTMESYPVYGEFLMKIVKSHESISYIIYNELGVYEGGRDESNVQAFHKDIDAVPMRELFETYDSVASIDEMSDDDMYLHDLLIESICRRIAEPGEYVHSSYNDYMRSTNVTYVRHALSRFEAKHAVNAHDAISSGAL